MLDEALREFRRVAELRPSDASAPFFLGLIALRQARWEERPTRSARRSRRAARGRRRSTTSASRSSGWAGSTRPTRRYGDAAGRAPRRRRGSCSAGRVVALKRGDYQRGAGPAGARHASCAGDKPRARRSGTGPPRSRAPGSTTPTAALATAAGRAPRPIPAAPCCGTTSPCCCELAGDVAGAETMLRAALAEDPSLPQISKNLADLLYRNGRYDDALEAYERAAKLAPDLGDDLYFKLGNIAYKRRDHDARPRELAARARAQSRPRARAGQSRDAGHRASDRRPTTRLRRAHPQDLAGAGFALEAYKDKCLRRRIAVRMRACGVHTLRRLPGAARPRARPSTSGCATRSRSTSPASTGTRRRGTCCARDAHPARSARPAPASSGCGAPAARRARRPYTLAILFAEHFERTGRARRARAGSPSTPPTSIGGASSGRTAARYRPESAHRDAAGELVAPLLRAGGRRSCRSSTRVRAACAVRRRDLSARRPPRRDYHLIVCRNVVIYFDRPMQERLFQLFTDSSGAGRLSGARQGRDPVRRRARPARASWIRASGSTGGRREPGARSSSGSPTSRSAERATCSSRSASAAASRSCCTIRRRASAGWRTCCCPRRR